MIALHTECCSATTHSSSSSSPLFFAKINSIVNRWSLIFRQPFANCLSTELSIRCFPLYFRSILCLLKIQWPTIIQIVLEIDPLSHALIFYRLCMHVKHQDICVIFHLPFIFLLVCLRKKVWLIILLSFMTTHIISLKYKLRCYYVITMDNETFKYFRWCRQREKGEWERG